MGGALLKAGLGAALALALGLAPGLALAAPAAPQTAAPQTAAPSAASAGVPQVGTQALPAPAQPDTVELPTATAPQREVWHMDGGLLAVRNVTRATLTAFRPVGRPADLAVIIAPGGAFLGLAIEKEGWQVARWYANHGITAFVLKYRTLPTMADQAAFAAELDKMIHGGKAAFAPPDDTPPAALADGLAALRYVRAHAAAYGVDPAKVGFMGFSAGGFLARSLVEQGGAERPDFVLPIYPNMAAMSVPADAPPMFVAVAADDFLLARAGPGLPLVDSYRRAGKSIEFHLFSGGGHGFGAGAPGSNEDGWLALTLPWLRARALLKGSY